MRSARVVVISDYIGGEGAATGGAGHGALDSYRALLAAGVDARVVTGFGDAPAGTRDRFRSLGGHDLRLGGPLDRARALYNPGARAVLTADLAGEDPDSTLVILHQWTRYLSPAALSVIDRFPTMIYMHDYFWVCPNGNYYDFREERPCDRRPMGLRCLAADCDRTGRVHKAARVIRQAIRERVVRAGPNRRLFVHLSAKARQTAGPLLPKERHAVLHNALDLPEQPRAPPEVANFDFGYFGRFEPEKGLRMLIAAADRLQLTGLFAGQGTLEPEIMDSPNLQYRPWAPRGEMAAAMRSCRVVVLPSLWPETWGLIVPEAMALGVKVLVSVRAGSAELVARFGGGATFDPAIPGDLDRRLEALARGPMTPVSDWPELRRTLASARHADRLVRLAAQRFGFDLLSPARPLSIPAASTRKAP